MRRNQVNRLLLRFFELLTHNWKVYELMENMLMETNCIMCFSFSKISKIQNTKLAKGFIVGQITWLYVIFSCILIYNYKKDATLRGPIKDTEITKEQKML